MRLIPFFAVDSMWRPLRTHISSVTRSHPTTPLRQKHADVLYTGTCFIYDGSGCCECVCIYCLWTIASVFVNTVFVNTDLM